MGPVCSVCSAHVGSDDSMLTAPGNYEASLAFDGLTSTCWWSSSTDPGSWIGLHVKTAAPRRSKEGVVEEDVDGGERATDSHATVSQNA